MKDRARDPHDAGLFADLRALRRYFWLPLATLTVAVAGALVLGSVHSGTNEARFRMNVLIDALPPLFGPTVLPGPFEYAAFAKSDAVLGQLAQQTGVPVAQLTPRLRAEARFNRPEVDLVVTGDNAVQIARAWHDAFVAAAPGATPALERTMTQSYIQQLDQARAQLDARNTAALASPNDAAAQQQLKAAQENYETAARLAQSYDVVAATMKAQPVTVIPPHAQTDGIGTTSGRLGAAIAIGLLAGVLGALALSWTSKRRSPVEVSVTEAPPSIRRARPS